MNTFKDNPQLTDLLVVTLEADDFTISNCFLKPLTSSRLLVSSASPLPQQPRQQDDCYGGGAPWHSGGTLIPDI